METLEISSWSLTWHTATEGQSSTDPKNIIHGPSNKVTQLTRNDLLLSLVFWLVLCIFSRNKGIGNEPIEIGLHCLITEFALQFSCQASPKLEFRVIKVVRFSTKVVQ